MPLDLEHTPSDIGSARSESALESIRAAFEQTKGPVMHFDVPVPGRNVRMRFHAFDQDLYDELTESSDRDKHLDFLAAACECILIAGEDGAWRPAQADGAPVRCDGSLAAVMGWPAESPRDEVLKLFEKVPMPRAAIRAHALVVDRWLNGLVEQREEETLGES